MTREEQIMKLQTYKMFEGEDTVYVDRDDVLKILEQEPCEDAISRQAVLDIAKTSKSNWIDNSVLFKKVNNLPPVTPQPKIDTWSIKEVADTLEKHGLIKEQEPCEDAVSRQALYEWLDGWKEKNKYYHPHTKNEIIPICEVIDIIQSLPSVTPKPKTGRWIDIMVGDMPAQACDQCNTFYPLAYTGGGHKFCPNCGAKMESEVEE